MSTEARLTSEALSQAIREKVAEANRLQRQLSDAGIKARAVQEALRHTLDEVAAYMHRETGLDVVIGKHMPGYLPTPMTDTPTTRTSAEFREIVVPTEPPISLVGGFQVQAGTDGAVTILAFWVAGNSRAEIATRSWTESFEGTFETPNRMPAVKKAGDALYSRRHPAVEFLLDALSA